MHAVSTPHTSVWSAFSLTRRCTTVDFSTNPYTLLQLFAHLVIDTIWTEKEAKTAMAWQTMNDNTIADGKLYKFRTSLEDIRWSSILSHLSYAWDTNSVQICSLLKVGTGPYWI